MPSTNDIPRVSSLDEVLGNFAGDTGRMKTGDFAALVGAVAGIGYSANKETRANLYADLDYPAQALGRVFGDANTNLRGVYQKSGGVGAGGWTRIGPLPETDVSNFGDLAAKDTVETADITDKSVTNAKMADMPEARIKGRAAGVGAPENLSAGAVRTLINVQDGATANATDAQLRSRGTHTGTQGIDTVDGLAAALASLASELADKAPSSSVSAVTTALAGKASAVSVDAVSTALSGKASTSSVTAAANIAIAARDAAAAMASALTVKSDLATEPTRHPADNILAFASVAVGAPATKPPVPAGWVANGPDGLPVIVLPARAALASRYGWRVADGARRLDVKLRRPHAVSDPASDGVRVAVQLLDARRKAIGFPIDIETLLDLTPDSGIYERSFVLGPETSGAIDVPLSPSAAFAVPLIQTYGDAGVEIDVFEHRDVSLLLDLMDRVATLEENV